eukprot:scaffold4381_cov48-Attheya_sp.AAC.1
MFAYALRTRAKRRENSYSSSMSKKTNRKLAGITQDKKRRRGQTGTTAQETNNNLECIHMGQASKALFC